MVATLRKASLRDERTGGSAVVPLFISHHLKVFKSVPMIRQDQGRLQTCVSARFVILTHSKYYVRWNYSFSVQKSAQEWQ